MAPRSFVVALGFAVLALSLAAHGSVAQSLTPVRASGSTPSKLTIPRSREYRVQGTLVHPAALARGNGSTVAAPPAAASNQPRSAIVPTEVPGGIRSAQRPLSRQPLVSHTGASGGFTFDTSFAGISHAQEQTSFPNQAAQAPDVDMAVGPTEIVQVTNSTMGVWNRSGTPVGGLVQLNDFFGAPAPTPDGNSHISRAVITYDLLSQRFFIAAANSDYTANAHVWLGVSSSSDANGAWTVYPVASSGTKQAQIVVQAVTASSDKVVVTFDNISGVPGTPAGPGVVLGKAALLNSGVVSAVHLDSFPSWLAGLVPAQPTSQTTTSYFVTWTRGSGTDCRVEEDLTEVDGAPGLSSVTINIDRAWFNVDIAACWGVRDIPQPGPTTLSTYQTIMNTPFGPQPNLYGVTRAVWQNGTLWMAVTVPCRWSPSAQQPDQRVCDLIVEATTQPAGPMEIITVLYLGNASAYWWGSSIALDQRGNLFFANYVATPTQAPVLEVNGIEVGASQGDTPYVLASSQQPISAPTTNACGCIPFGITTAIEPDPVDPSKMWVTGEYYATGSQSSLTSLPWATTIGEITVPSTTPTDNLQHLYTLDGWGGVHAAAASAPLSCTAYWPGWDIARGLALTSDGTGAYLLDGWGGVHACGSAPPVATTSYWPGWDIARGIAVRRDGRSGYVLDGWGGIHAFGGAPAMQPRAYWRGWDIARGIVLDGDDAGGYVLDGWGGLHPFGNAPALLPSGYWPHWDIARGIALDNDAQGGYVLDGLGGLHPFGNAPQTLISNYFGWDIARGVVMWSDSIDAYPGGWVLDGWGGIWPFGAAPDVNTSAWWKGWDIARSISGAGDSGGGRNPLR